MRVCAVRRNDTYILHSRYNATTCQYVEYEYSNYDHDDDRHYRYFKYRLPPGGNVTVHFDQLVVADVITIRKYSILTLCEVDVLGTRVVLDSDGKFTG